MNWLCRYLLGLPARKQDIKELKTNFPELIDYLEKLRELHYPFIIHPRKFTENDFKKWILASDELEKNNDTSLNECPFSNCPLKKQQDISNSQENDLLELMTIGGHKKTPKASFFDMVKKVYQGINNIKKVILTDPYLIIDVSADGNEGGFNSIVEYLEIIIDNAESNFELQISPTLKNDKNINNFKRLIKNKFTNVSFSYYKSKYNFHDRLLITIDSQNNYKGIFGPSFNGLNSNSIVLYGELETKNTMDRLKKWFE